MSSPRRFHEAYCGRVFDGYGWNVDGETPRAMTELKRRTSILVLKRTYAECWGKDAPPKLRQPIYHDIDGVADITTQEYGLDGALLEILKLKIPNIIESVMEDLSAGYKTIVWAHSRRGAELLAEALEEAMNSRQYRALKRKFDMSMWATHGEAPADTRVKLAELFRNHNGAGVFVATMDSLPEAASLKGASTEHYAQLHRQAGPFFQSENRAYHPDIGTLPILYHIAKNSVEEKMINDLLDRIGVLQRLADEKDAEETIKAFQSQEEEESIEEYQARIFGRMPADAGGASFDPSAPMDGDAEGGDGGDSSDD